MAEALKRSLANVSRQDLESQFIRKLAQQKALRKEFEALQEEVKQLKEKQQQDSLLPASTDNSGDWDQPSPCEHCGIFRQLYTDLKLEFSLSDSNDNVEVVLDAVRTQTQELRQAQADIRSITEELEEAQDQQDDLKETIRKMAEDLDKAKESAMAADSTKSVSEAGMKEIQNLKDKLSSSEEMNKKLKLLAKKYKDQLISAEDKEHAPNVDANRLESEISSLRDQLQKAQEESDRAQHHHIDSKERLMAMEEEKKILEAQLQETADNAQRELRERQNQLSAITEEKNTLTDELQEAMRKADDVAKLKALAKKYKDQLAAAQVAVQARESGDLDVQQQLSRLRDDVVEKDREIQSKLHQISELEIEVREVRQSLELARAEAIKEAELVKEKGKELTTNQELSDARSDIERKTAEIEDLQGKLRAQREQFNSQRVVLKEKAAQDADRLRSLLPELDELRGRIESHEQTINELEQKLHEATEQRDTFQRNANDLTNDLQQALQRKQGETTEVDSLKDQVRSKTKKVDNLEASLAQSQKDLLEVQEALKKTKSREKEISEKEASAVTTLQDKTQALERSQQQNQKLKIYAKQMKDKVEMLETHIKDLQQAHGESAKQSSAYESDVRDAEAARQKIEDELAQERMRNDNEITELRSEVRELQFSILTLTEEKAAVEYDLEMQAQEFRTFKEEHERIALDEEHKLEEEKNSGISALKEEIVQLKKELQGQKHDLTAEIDAWRSKCDTVDATLQRTKAKLRLKENSDSEEIEKYRLEIEQHLKKIQRHEQRIQVLEDTVQESDAKLKALSSMPNPMIGIDGSAGIGGDAPTSAIQGLEKENEKLKNRLADLKDQIRTLQKTGNYHGHPTNGSMTPESAVSSNPTVVPRAASPSPYDSLRLDNQPVPGTAIGAGSSAGTLQPRDVAMTGSETLDNSATPAATGSSDDDLRTRLWTTLKDMKTLRVQLRETESFRQKSDEQVKVLKEEIRRLRMNESRADKYNPEYVKNLIYNFIISKDRGQLLPALATVLEFTPEEKTKAQSRLQGGGMLGAFGF
eukprot:Clim_evm14s204 gene=Clim_evmTU14s204